MELKYKVWDKENNRMIEPVKLMQVRPVLDILGNLGIIDIPNECEWKGIVPRNQYELLPYTGVKDINKKECYLGDIVKEPNNKYDYGIIEKESESNNMFITWWYPSNADCKLWNSMKLKLSYIKQFEVIGNIYTNPDMIKKEG